VTEKEKPDRRREAALQKLDPATGSDVWLARFFLLAVIGAGLVSLLSGASPESLAFWPCPFHLVTHMECPGCGMTRACIALARGDIGNALHYNPLSLGLVLFAAGFALAPRRMRRCWQALSRNTRLTCTWAMLVLVLGFWAYRIML
jgi:hypothetical protein